MMVPTLLEPATVMLLRLVATIVMVAAVVFVIVVAAVSVVVVAAWFAVVVMVVMVMVMRTVVLELVPPVTPVPVRMGDRRLAFGNGRWAFSSRRRLVLIRHQGGRRQTNGKDYGETHDETPSN